MIITLIVTLSLLVAIAIIGNKVSQLPSNVWLIFLAQPLALSSATMVVFAGGLLGSKIAPSADLATIPITVMILMAAIGVIPAALSMKHFGRRMGTILGLLVAIVGALISAYAALHSQFILLILGIACIGFSLAFVAQLRFAVIESLKDSKDSPKAISVLMLGSMFAAILGPEVTVIAKDWIDSPNGYVGSFLSLALMLFIALLIISRLAPIGVAEQKNDKIVRNLKDIIVQPLFIIAVCSAAVAYGVMSYIMTASPLSMHDIKGHDLAATKWVIQSHIVAMYLPSLFSALLIRYCGLSKLMFIGTLIYFLVILVALSGQHVMHYWWAMVLLGVGWNFLYTSGTILLPESYHANERFKVQAINDLFIFIIQALASLLAGWILFNYGWNWLNQLAIPFIVLMLFVSVWFLKMSDKKAKF